MAAKISLVQKIEEEEEENTMIYSREDSSFQFISPFWNVHRGDHVSCSGTGEKVNPRGIIRLGKIT